MKFLYKYAIVLFLILLFPVTIFAEEEPEPGFLEQDMLRVQRPLQAQVNIYHGLTSVGLVYNINRYLSAGWFYQKDYNLQFNRAYSIRDWVKDSIYFQNGDTYIYGASRAKLDWSGPQTFLNLRVFPVPEIPIYISANVGRDVHGDIGEHDVMLSYNASKNYWVIGQPIYMSQEGTPYWFRTIGLGTVVHLPYGFFVDAHYTEGEYFHYKRTMHIWNDARIFATNGYRVNENFELVPESNAAMTLEEVALSTYLMDARHRERGHTGRHVIYAVWIGYATGF